MEKLNLQSAEVVSEDPARSFDRVADGYDRSFGEHPLSLQLRQRIYAIVERLISPGSSILDMNCGTGTDALYFASKGHHVLGIDASGRMIEQAERKARPQGAGNVEFRVGSFEQLTDLTDHRHDLLLSNFGGLNCIDDLSRISRELPAVVKPHGFFVAVVMPRFSFWETASALVHGKWRLAGRRWKGFGEATGFGEGAFWVWYHSPTSLRAALCEDFDLRDIIGLNVVSPPPTAGNRARSHGRFVTLLQRLDSLSESWPVFRSAGDHYVMVFQRKAR